MRQAPIRRALFLSVGAYTWTGSTWALSGGRAYNTPTGENVVTNNNFSSSANWTLGSGWSISGGKLIGTALAGNIAASANSGASIGTAGQWTLISYVVDSASGAIQARAGTGFGTLVVNSAATGSLMWLGRWPLTSAFSFTGIGPATNCQIDDVAFRPLALASLSTTVVGVAGQTVTAKPYAITSGTQAGVVSHLDSAVSPANFIIAYHDGTGVTLDKCVGGTWSNVIPRVTVAFASDAVIEIRRPSGNTFQLWYGGTQRGTDQTISDAGIISNTRYGLFSTYSANTFSEGLTLGGVLIPFRF